MERPAIPGNESERVQSLTNLHLLDTPIEESFERLTRITKALFSVPIAVFTLIDSERQWFKSAQGFEHCETSRETSFCAHAINQDDIFLIKDALLDPRFADNPSVVNDPKIRFYAGYPISSPDGYKIGTICIIDTKPRNFTTQELESLKDIGALIETEIAAKKINLNQKKLMNDLKDAKRAQYIDNLTRLWNRGGIEKLLIQQVEFSKMNQEEFGIAIMDIDNFKSINDKYGHCAGDSVLREVSKRLLSASRESDLIGRWGGEEFLVIINSNDHTELFDIAERIRKNICHSPVLYNDINIPVSVTIGLDAWNATKSLAVNDMVSEADLALYEGKKSGKNKVVCRFSNGHV